MCLNNVFLLGGISAEEVRCIATELVGEVLADWPRLSEAIRPMGDSMDGVLVRLDLIEARLDKIETQR